MGGQTVALIVGTRPEAVKIAPLVAALQAEALTPRVVDVGQQPGRVAEALAPFTLAPDASLAVERPNGDLNELIAAAITAADRYLRSTKPTAVIVQGDTSTALAVGLAAAMLSIPVVHLEAGLRTGNRQYPFPEETNRVLLAGLATLHLAPTPLAARALAAEGVTGSKVVVTGNTIVDSLNLLLPTIRERRLPDGITVASGYQLLAVTVHRRESWGLGVRTVAETVKRLLGERANLHAAVVTHPNPAVRDDVLGVLAGTPRCDLLPPLAYDEMLSLLYQSDVVMTDSGGIQEEAPTLRIPAVVTRVVTERPEGVAAGWADLVGTSASAIHEAVSRRLDHPDLPPSTRNPYGDGFAARRSARAIGWLLGRGERPEDWVPGETNGIAPRLSA